MSVPGITIPKLLPITGTFAPGFALYHCILSYRVSQQRLAAEKWIGDKSSSSGADSSSSSSPDALLLTTRCHQNFAENVPLAMFLGAVVEMNGGNRKVLTGGFAALLLFRILHVEFGLKGKDTLGAGRIVGHFGSLGFIAGMAGYAAWLVKGYWGF